MARLAEKMLPSAAMLMSLSRLPAGTTTMLAFANGSAEPHVAQKLRWCRVPGSWKAVTELWPESQLSFAVDENRLAEWAEPVSLRQWEQWQR